MKAAILSINISEFSDEDLSILDNVLKVIIMGFFDKLKGWKR